MTEHHETLKHFIDGVSIITALGTLIDMLPAVAAILSIIWSLLRIWESKTVQDWLNKDAKQQ
jgi:hypothetical protein